LGGRPAGGGIHLHFQHLKKTKFRSGVVTLVIFSMSRFVDGIE